MTADCYCKGSDELDSLLRCKYTSVPYLLRGEGSSLAIKALSFSSLFTLHLGLMEPWVELTLPC